MYRLVSWGILWVADVYRTAKLVIAKVTPVAREEQPYILNKCQSLRENKAKSSWAAGLSEIEVHGCKTV